MHPDITMFPTVLAAADLFIDAMTAAGLFDDDWREALLSLVLTLEADLLTLGDAPVEWVQ
jgi:hypothetical protein